MSQFKRQASFRYSRRMIHQGEQTPSESCRREDYSSCAMVELELESVIDETVLNDIVGLNQTDKPITLEQLVDASIARDKVNGASTHNQLPLN
jgi:hypothetical protein